LRVPLSQRHGRDLPKLRELRKGPVMHATLRLTLLFFFFTLSFGCAKRTLVALAPDPDGKVGTVYVTSEAGQVSLDAPYQATSIGAARQRPTKPEDLGREKVMGIFAEALSIQPERPRHFMLYFDKDISLTAESAKLLPSIIAAIQERNSADISVVGHTDTVGSRDYNTELSNRRAASVKELLVGLGVAAQKIRTTSHGKENPLIPTADNVNEPRNRRVEVDVR
jgi:outer membrane protein OmpA-like peptidoglycan-associated protein